MEAEQGERRYHSPSEAADLLSFAKTVSGLTVASLLLKDSDGRVGCSHRI